MEKKIVAVLFGALLLVAIVFPAVYADPVTSGKGNNGYEPILKLSEKQKQAEDGEIQLTQAQLDKLNEFVESLGKEKREKTQKVIGEIITHDGKLNLKAVKAKAEEFYESVSSVTGPAVEVCGGYDGKFVGTNENTETLPLFGIETSGIETTVFKPIDANTAHSFSPWDPDGYHWGRAEGIADEENNANAYSGAVGALTDAWIGGAAAEGMHYVRFYADGLEIVSVNAEIYYSGGGATVGWASFAGTYKSRSNWMPFDENWDSWQDNYHKSTIDSPWDPEDIIPKIIGLVCLWVPGIEDIAEAIEMISFVNDYLQLLMAMNDLVNAGDAEVHHVTFSFLAEPGYHEVYAGLRSQASGCITGTGIGVAFGQVSKITIQEIRI